VEETGLHIKRLCQGR